MKMTLVWSLHLNLAGMTFHQDVDEVQAPDGLYPLLPFIVDPNVVFKYDTTLTSPTELYAHNVSTYVVA
jgi:hypothetical protein